MLLAFIPSPLELLIVAGIALLLFGSRIPNLMRSIGKSIPEFKKGMSDVHPGSGETKPRRR